MECWGHQAGLRERCLRFQTCLSSVSPHSQQIQGKEENDVTVTMKMLLEFLFFLFPAVSLNLSWLFCRKRCTRQEEGEKGVWGQEVPGSQPFVWVSSVRAQTDGAPNADDCQ